MRTDAPPYYTAADRPRLNGASLSGMLGGRTMTGSGGSRRSSAPLSIAAGLLLMLLVNTMVNGLGGDSRSYDVVFGGRQRLRVGDDVKVAGVRVGRGRVDRGRRRRRRVELVVSEQQALLDTTSIVMRYQNLSASRISR